jgi:hypothetical protein
MAASASQQVLIIGASSDGRLAVETVDITVPEQVALHERLARTAFDLLFVNAGVTNGPRHVDTIEVQAAKGGLQYLDYQGQAVAW